MSNDITIHQVGIAIDGHPTYIVEVPSTLGREAAERRAVMSIFATKERGLTLDRITVCPVPDDEPAAQHPPTQS